MDQVLVADDGPGVERGEQNTCTHDSGLHENSFGTV